MSPEKNPYHLRLHTDEIVMIAREHITIHYMRGTRGMGCKITDHNDYSEYFYEPNKYGSYESRTIIYGEQMSAHQNAVIALAKWEEHVRDFLEKPKKKNENEAEDAEKNPTPKRGTQKK